MSTATVELAVAAAGLLLSVGMALLVARTLVGPLRRLQASMRQVEQGDLNVTSGVTSSDELGQLAMSFDHMVEGLRRQALVRDLFVRYVTPALAKAAIEHRAELDRQLVTCTVLFVDIRSPGSRRRFRPRGCSDPQRVLRAHVVRHRGRERLGGQFGGDSLLAVFGTPLNPDPTTRSAACSRPCDRASPHGPQPRAERRVAPADRCRYRHASGDVVAGTLAADEARVHRHRRRRERRVAPAGDDERPRRAHPRRRRDGSCGDTVRPLHVGRRGDGSRESSAGGGLCRLRFERRVT